MRTQKTVNIKQILDNPTFADLMKKGLLLNNLNQQLQESFAHEFKELYQVVNIQGKTLNIDVQNATVRQALLFRHEELLQIAQQYSSDIQQVKYNVNPHLHFLNSTKQAKPTE